MIDIRGKLAAVSLQIMMNTAPGRRLQQLGVMTVVPQVPYRQFGVRAHRKSRYHNGPVP
jgi:hypothetical protein